MPKYLCFRFKLTIGYFQTIARPTPVQNDKEYENNNNNKKTNSFQHSAVPFVCILFALYIEIDYGNDWKLFR